MDARAGGRCGRIGGSRHKLRRRFRTSTSAPTSKSIDAGRTDGLLTGPSNATPERIALDYVRDALRPRRRPTSPTSSSSPARSARTASPTCASTRSSTGSSPSTAASTRTSPRDGRLINVTGAPVPRRRLAGHDARGQRRSPGLGEARRTDARARAPAARRPRAAAPRTTLRHRRGGHAALDRHRRRRRGSRGTSTPRAAESLVHRARRRRVGRHARPQGPDRAPRRRPLLPARPGHVAGPTQITMPPSWYDEQQRRHAAVGPVLAHLHRPQRPGPRPGLRRRAARASRSRQQQPGQPGLALHAPRRSRPRRRARSAAARGTPRSRPRRDDQPVPGGDQRPRARRPLPEYLAQPPIGFDEASGNFQRVNASGAGLGNDYIRTEVNDGQGLNNANFATPPDGNAPRMQMYLFTRRNVERQRRRRRRLPRDRSRPRNRLIVNASGSRHAQRDPGVDDGRGVERLLRARPAASRGLGDRHRRAARRHDRHPRRRAERHPLQADRLPGRPGRLRQLQPQRHGHRGARRLHLRRPHPHQQRRRTAQRRRGVGRDAVGHPPRGRPRRRAGADHRRHAADAPTTRRCSTRATRSSSRRSRCAPRRARRTTTSPRLWEIFRARGMGFDATTTEPRTRAPDRELQRAAERALRSRDAGAARPVPGRRQRRRDRARRARRGLRARVLRGPDRPARRDRDARRSADGATIEDGSATWPLLGKGRTAANADPLVGADARRLRGGRAAHGHRDLARRRRPTARRARR